MSILFPKNFLWGTATSSHQVEGDNTNNDWWEAEQKGLVSHKSGKACDSYNRYEEDFDLAKTMANNAHRFSIEWSRIEPEEGKFNEEEIEHYRKILQALRVRGLEPFVTLHHFTNPIWFAQKGGWANKKAPEYFERYVKYVASHLGKEVTYWITINEPLVFVEHAYLKGHWPPFHRVDAVGIWRVLRNMLQAHRRAYGILHELLPGAMVSVASNSNYYEPSRGILGPVNKLLVNTWRYVKNFWIFDQIQDVQDFIGINSYKHYGFSLARGFFQLGELQGDFGWKAYPEGLCHVVKEIYQKYKKPIYITENGISDADDDQRADFIKKHLKWLHKAIEEGADVRGYFYWSLLDNFEWAEGFTQRFGLVEVNFDLPSASSGGGGLERKVRPSGVVYGEICKNNGLAYSGETKKPCVDSLQGGP